MKPRIELRASVNQKSLDIVMYGSIGSDYWDSANVTAADVIRQLQESPNVETINIFMNSPGGSVLDGIAIYNALDRHRARVVVNIDGIAASIASVIAMAGDDIRIAENGFVMIHNPIDISIGTADDMRHVAEVLDKATDQIVLTYQRRTAGKESDIRAMMDAETWLTATEAKARGFATEVTPAKKMAAHFDLDNCKSFKKMPDAAKQLVAIVAPPSPADPSPQGGLLKEVRMLEPTTPAPADNQPKAATLQELKAALDGAPADFILACLEKQQTVTDALRDWVKRLSADRGGEAEASAKTIAELKGQIAVTVPATKGVGTASASGTTKRGDSQDEWERRVAADFPAAAKAYREDKGLKSLTDAMRALSSRYPEAHREWVASIEVKPVK